MSSPATNQSYNYGYSSSSNGSTYTGGRGSSNGAMLGRWVTTQDQTERFYTTGQTTGQGALPAMETTLEFDRRFYGNRRN
ncbi:hypothetical protein F53441_1708 [Fusarium austroafricanum]|uniref:Uncharacterized protein n=1 Tax=Fusarium austroafricanum TaxID=2364996 RepID=A0A8H4P3P8_9HYPO|nr:hypothetical protein F53441_1708 [Fusarium austroafricanum]